MEVTKDTVSSMTYDDLKRCFLARKKKLYLIRRNHSQLSSKAKRKVQKTQTAAMLNKLTSERNMCEVEMYCRRMKEPIEAIPQEDIDATLKIWSGKKPRQRYALVQASDDLPDLNFKPWTPPAEAS